MIPSTGSIGATIEDDGGYYPSVDWFDLDGDGIQDLYGWGNGALSALRNLENTSLGVQTTVLSGLGTPLLGIRPWMGVYDGADKIADALVFGGTPTQPTLRYYRGKGAFGAQPFEAPVDLITDAAFYAPFFAAVQAASLPSPYVASLTVPGGRSMVAALTDSIADANGLSLPNAFFLLPDGAPGILAVPDLRVGKDESDRNFVFDDVDGDGKLDLIVSPPADASGKVVLRAYRLENDANDFPFLAPLLNAAGAPPFQDLETPSCPMPTNRVRLIDVDGDARPDYVCLRPGAIDVQLATGATATYGKRTRSEFPFVQASDPLLQGTEADPFYPWASHASLVDVTGDDLPDYLNTAFTSQIWYRPNLGGGKFGPMELWETPNVKDATNTTNLGLDSPASG